jgi:protoporphyrinogen oxidase
MIIIVGAGLTGLSTAYHLGNAEYQIYEKEEEVGGLCRSFKKKGYAFDFTGHLLHLKSTYASELVGKLLPHKLKSHRRRASVSCAGTLTAYPFQANLHTLPKEVIKECVVGFLEAREKSEKMSLVKPASHTENVSFKDWIINTFGAGIAKHFMIPYNEKMWSTDLSELSSEWVSWSIPVPSLDEVIGGALGLESRQMGYSAKFLYPEKGGIEILPRAFLPHVKNLYLRRRLCSIDLQEKRAWFDDNSSAAYEHLVSTIPLPELLTLIRDLPASIASLKEGLRHVSVLDVNVGIGGDGFSDQHWIYFPHSDVAFYRVGFYSNFSSNLAPPFCSSVYAEVSYLPGGPFSKTEMVERVYAGLEKSGFLKGRDSIVVDNVVEIPYAYVIHDTFRHTNLPRIFDFLSSHGIYSVGRFGGWTYSSMEDALLQGKEVAEIIHGKNKSSAYHY